MCQKYKQIRLQISLCFITFKIFYLHFYLFKMTCCHCYNNIQTKCTVAPLSYEISHRKWYKRSFLKSKDSFFAFVKFHGKTFHTYITIMFLILTDSNIICLLITFISVNMISIIIFYCSLNYFSKANEAY